MNSLTYKFYSHVKSSLQEQNPNNTASINIYFCFIPSNITSSKHKRNGQTQSLGRETQSLLVTGFQSYWEMQGNKQGKEQGVFTKAQFVTNIRRTSWVIMKENKQLSKNERKLEAKECRLHVFIHKRLLGLDGKGVYFVTNIVCLFIILCMELRVTCGNLLSSAAMGFKDHTQVINWNKSFFPTEESCWI